MFRDRALAGLCFVLIGVSFPAHGLAASPPAGWEERVVDYVQQEMASLGAPGAAVAVVSGTGVLLTEAFGVTSSGGAPVTPDTPFHIASLSKSLTALAVAQQIKAGALSLTDSLGDLVPGLLDETRTATSVTVADLLGHTSGWSARHGLINWVDPGEGDGALERNVIRLLETEPANDRGVFEYSNANYDVLGYLVETTSNVAYAEYMSRHVFGPLGMSSTSTPSDPDYASGAARGHYPVFSFVRPHPMTVVPSSTPLAYVSARVRDLGRFLTMILNDGVIEGRRLVSEETIEMMRSPLSYISEWEAYAMGLWVYPHWSSGRFVAGSDGSTEYRAPVVLEHQGDLDSYASSMLLLPEEDLGVVVLLNINDESKPSLYHQIHFGIAEILVGAEPIPSQAYEDPIRLYVKPLALVLIALALLRVFFMARIAFRRRGETASPGRRAVRVVVPGLIELGVIAAVWWLMVSESGVPLSLVRRSTPDIYWSFVLATVLLAALVAARVLVESRRASPRRVEQ